GDDKSSVTGAASCAIGFHAEAAGTNAGVVSCTPGTLEADNYSFVVGDAADLVIEKAVLTVNADPKSKTYGSDDPDLTATRSGFVNSDSASIVAVSGQASCTRDSGQVVGSYTITCGPGDLSAHDYTFVAGTTAQLQIEKAPLTLTADDQSRT